MGSGLTWLRNVFQVIFQILRGLETHCAFSTSFYKGDNFCDFIWDILGPFVQSVVSLKSSLRVIWLTVLADSIHNILIFFAEKMWVAFALQKLLTFFQQKISAYLHITRCKF